jgi:hypothetical protein
LVLDDWAGLVLVTPEELVQRAVTAMLGIAAVIVTLQGAFLFLGFGGVTLFMGRSGGTLALVAFGVVILWLGATVVLFVRRKHLGSLAVAWGPIFVWQGSMAYLSTPLAMGSEGRANHRMYLAHDDLDRLANAEANFYADSNSYTSDIGKLGFRASDEVTVTFLSASTRSWSAAATVARSPNGRCGIAVDQATPESAGHPFGEVICTGNWALKRAATPPGEPGPSGPDSASMR